MPRNFNSCPRCGAPTVKSFSYSGQLSEFWLECTECNTYINTYIPQEHQAAVHVDDHKYIGNFGAYGTGKTLTSREELYKHIFLTPNANALIGANITPQYEQTIKRDFEQDFPAAFISDYKAQKSYYDLINGARILFRPFDDPDKLRSLNLTFFVIVEASEVKGEAFHQLKTRLRNLNATTPELDEENNILYDTLTNGVQIPRIGADWRKGIIESNPDAGWIRTDILLNSSQITKHGRVADDYQIPEHSQDPAISTHVASTDVNSFLPKTFIQELTKNKPAWWINRYIHSSFSYSEGLVYPSAGGAIVPPFAIPNDWKHIVAADYGLSDDFVYLFGAVDPKHGILYIYKCISTKNRNIDDLAKMYYKETADIPSGMLWGQPILDPKSGAKRDYDKKTLYDHFLDKGIAFKPGHVSVDARVYRTNTYFESGKLKIMSNCIYLTDELADYKFPSKSLSGSTKGDPNKPIDKNNHAINPLEWICMELPADPRDLLFGIYNKYGDDVTQMPGRREQYMPYALQDTISTTDDNYAYGMEVDY